jgi:hypothetical protein
MFCFLKCRGYGLVGVSGGFVGSVMLMVMVG